MAEKLTREIITQSLESSLQNDWSLNDSGDQIERLFEFSNYYQTMAFANAVAWNAHQKDHHPDMLITYKTCRITFTTHSAGGLTQLDFDSARTLDQLASNE